MSKLWCFFGIHSFNPDKEKKVKKFGRKMFKNKCEVCKKVIYANTSIK